MVLPMKYVFLEMYWLYMDAWKSAFRKLYPCKLNTQEYGIGDGHTLV